MGKPFRTYTEGVDEHEIRRAAHRYRTRTDFLTRVDQAKGPGFAQRLRSHLSAGLPAILLVDDFGHWVALVGYLTEREQFIVMDPDDRDHAFSRWSEHTLLRKGWNHSDDTGEPDQYFAILTRRRDGKPPRWRINEAFLRLCELGSEQTADEMANDLVEMARRACPSNAEAPGLSLDQVLEQHERVVLASVEHWAAYNRRTVKPAHLKSLSRDYTTIAAAAGIRLARGADLTAIAAQMTTVLTTYAWTGTL